MNNPLSIYQKYWLILFQETNEIHHKFNNSMYEPSRRIIKIPQGIMKISNNHKFSNHSQVMEKNLKIIAQKIGENKFQRINCSDKLQHQGRQMQFKRTKNKIKTKNYLNIRGFYSNKSKKRIPRNNKKRKGKYKKIYDSKGNLSNKGQMKS